MSFSTTKIFCSSLYSPSSPLSVSIFHLFPFSETLAPEIWAASCLSALPTCWQASCPSDSRSAFAYGHNAAAGAECVSSDLPKRGTCFDSYIRTPAGTVSRGFKGGNKSLSRGETFSRAFCRGQVVTGTLVCSWPLIATGPGGQGDEKDFPGITGTGLC